jgi:hypothetical protein
MIIYHNLIILGAGCSAWFGSPQRDEQEERDSQKSASFSPNYDQSQNLSQSSNHSGITGSGHYSGRETRSSQSSSSSTLTSSSENSQMYFGLSQRQPEAQQQTIFSPDINPMDKPVFFQL